MSGVLSKRAVIFCADDFAVGDVVDVGGLFDLGDDGVDVGVFEGQAHRLLQRLLHLGERRDDCVGFAHHVLLLAVALRHGGETEGVGCAEVNGGFGPLVGGREPFLGQAQVDAALQVGETDRLRILARDVDAGGDRLLRSAGHKERFGSGHRRREVARHAGAQLGETHGVWPFFGQGVASGECLLPLTVLEEPFNFQHFGHEAARYAALQILQAGIDRHIGRGRYAGYDERAQVTRSNRRSARRRRLLRPGLAEPGFGLVQLITMYSDEARRRNGVVAMFFIRCVVCFSFIPDAGSAAIIGVNHVISGMRLPPGRPDKTLPA